MWGAMAGFILSWLLGQFWIAVASAFLAMPAAWIFNLRCSTCSWLVYRAHGTAKAGYSNDQFLAPLYSKQLWKQPVACSKCGASFRSHSKSMKVDY
jgi:hypothetical protein